MDAKESKYKVDLDKRLLAFSVSIIRFLQTLPYKKEFDVFRYQLSKSATSIGANYSSGKIAGDMQFYYTYVLRSEKDSKNYIGFSKDLKLRFEQHNNGEVDSTKNRRPFKLIYYEACLSKEDAIHREKYLKTLYGRMFLKNRLKSYLTG